MFSSLCPTVAFVLGSDLSFGWRSSSWNRSGLYFVVLHYTGNLGCVVSIWSLPMSFGFGIWSLSWCLPISCDSRVWSLVQWVFSSLGVGLCSLTLCLSTSWDFSRPDLSWSFCSCLPSSSVTCFSWVKQIFCPFLYFWDREEVFKCVHSRLLSLQNMSKINSLKSGALTHHADHIIRNWTEA